MTEPTDLPVPSATEPGDDTKLADKPKLRNRRVNTRLVTAAATGIGSAAIVAALLYANRSRKGKK